MSPAFINRFDVIVLENQIEKISDENLENLISFLFVSFDKIPKKNISNGSFKGGNNYNNFENNEIKESNNPFTEKMFLKKLVEKINSLPTEDNSSNCYNHKKTISAISQFCYSVKILKNKLNDPLIDDSQIINIIFNLLFHNNINEIEFDEQIQNRLFYDLLQFNNENHEKYFFDKSPSLRKFVVIVYLSSLIK